MALDKHIFCIWGPPGSGKTTLAVNMATLLADSGYMTCLVSASDHGQLQGFFGTAIPKNKGLYAAITNGRNIREYLIEARQNLCLLELDTGGDAYDLLAITPQQVEDIISDLRDQFTYVIIDCTSYKEAPITGIGLKSADKIVICVPHRASAAMWHNAYSQMIEVYTDKVVYVDVNIRAGGCNMEQLLASMDLPECDIQIGCVDSAFYYENTSSPIVLQGGKREKAYKKALLTLIRALLKLEEEEKTALKHGKPTKEKKRKSLRKTEGLNASQKKMSARAQRKAEEEYMRQMSEDDEY